MTLKISDLNEDIIHNIIKLSTWTPANIIEQPEVQLRNWTIKNCTDGNQYFIGDEVGATGRVSTAIVEFDQEKKLGKTKSGRIYELLGESRYSSDGEYVWGIYMHRNGLTEKEV